MLRRPASAAIRLRTRVVAAALAAAGCRSSTDSAAPTGAETARLVTEDIPRFWAAFDAMQSSTDTVRLRRDYLDAGSVGLKDFTALRWKDAKTLAAMIWPRRDYYRSIKWNTLAVAALEPEIRRIYRVLDTLYADAVYPDVYFAIGGMGTGGTTSDHGLLIGTELFARAADSPMNVLTPWEQSVVRASDILPAIVAHELTHYQQRGYRTAVSTLLGESIREGGADFVSELLTGRTINEHMRAYGDAHEREIWIDFRDEMNGSDHSRWLYNGGTITATSDRPADLGYYVGYRITRAYYQRQADKRQALREIFTIRDFAEFLAASGYAARFAP
jgi:hypothetical protein